MNESKNPWNTTRRWVIVGLAAWAAAALLYAVYRPRPITVEVAQVTSGKFEQVVEEDGQLRLKNRYVITAPTLAQLQRPTLKVGDAVQAGDVVARLAPAAPQLIDARTRTVLQQRVGSADAARRAAAAQVQRAQTALAQATLEAGRSDQLAQRGFIAPSARDQTDLARRSAQQALTAAQAEQAMADFAVAEARAALAQAVPTAGERPAGLWAIKSPVNGQVLKLHLDSAAPVTAGQSLLEIGDTAAMEAVIDVLSGEVRQVLPGAAVLLTTGSGAAPLPGTVTRVEPVAFTKVSALGIEEQRVNVVVALAALPTDAARLGDGFRVDARITVSSQADAVLVPSAALVRDGELWRVFVVDAGKARARAVQIHDRNADTAWVKDGVKAGETVLLYPGSTIADGQPVRTR
ncbi:MAG: efflux transporter periplasmic adaptor subunit [Betaproteobacteria bacterium HGW-Betaproteobacteria-15]|nr:MAG: efflux transporter periplasmic adaptor subunit [Betaproteobacteria bacterium HGW-Betaproteobacteria-15]